MAYFRRLFYKYNFKNPNIKHTIHFVLQQVFRPVHLCYRLLWRLSLYSRLSVFFPLDFPDSRVIEQACAAEGVLLNVLDGKRLNSIGALPVSGCRVRQRKH